MQYHLQAQLSNYNFWNYFLNISLLLALLYNFYHSITLEIEYRFLF